MYLVDPGYGPKGRVQRDSKAKAEDLAISFLEAGLRDEVHVYSEDGEYGAVWVNVDGMPTKALEGTHFSIMEELYPSKGKYERGG